MKKAISMMLALVVAASMGASALAADAQEPLISPASVIASNPDSTASLKIMVNGQEILMNSFEQNNCVMVPVHAICEALGFTVTWNPDQTVHIDNGIMQSELTIGKDFYTVCTSNPKLVGMSAPFSLGAAPVLKNNSTYVPVTLFIPLYGNNPDVVTIKDGVVTISTESDDANQIPCPISTHKTIGELEDAVDFDIDVPTMPAGYTISALEDISRELAQIIFTKDDKSVCYRMSKGDQDNSGDYTLYSTKKELKAEDISVEIRGNDAIHVAVWFDDGYAYSIHAPSGLSEEEIINIVKSIL